MFTLKMARPSVDQPMECISGCEGTNFVADEWYRFAGWDGKFNGEDVPNNRGTYFYVLTVKCCNEQPKPVSGYLQLFK